MDPNTRLAAVRAALDAQPVYALLIDTAEIDTILASLGPLAEDERLGTAIRWACGETSLLWITPEQMAAISALEGLSDDIRISIHGAESTPMLPLRPFAEIAGAA